MVREDDERATNPGDTLKDLFNKYAPCLILIDEWVAYARQLHSGADLPAGTFDTQFTFAQALSEAAKAAKQTLLVVSIPASESPHQRADRGVTDIEVGGERGREALARLKNAVGRVEASWRPASSDEGFEIVRRRLFQPLTGEQFVARDAVARAFSELYGAAAAGVPARMPGGRLRTPDEDGVSDSPRTLRPALQRLVHPRQVPADPRRSALDGRRDSFALGAARRESADHAGDHPDRRPARAVRADPLSGRPVGPGHRKGRGRSEFAAARPRPRESEPRSILRLPAGRSHHLHGLGPDPECSPTAASTSGR